MPPTRWLASPPGALTAWMLSWGSVCRHVERDANRFIPSTHSGGPERTHRERAFYPSYALILGSGPLVAIMIAARLGVGHDPDPNPIFFGMLAGLTFWPSIILILVGAWRVRRKQNTS